MPGSIEQAGLGRLSSLVHLHIVNTNLPALPENLGDLRELVVLLLEKCHAMTSLPSSIVTLPKLQQIDLKSLPLLTHLPENLGQLKALNELGLDPCKTLQDLPSSCTLLSSLIQLSIINCYEGPTQRLGQFVLSEGGGSGRVYASEGAATLAGG
ncbi:unnamed protein product [Closterium sp. NIES-64]|nr:unnamed protein product [Closterium sp. NIES-64]